MPGPNSGGGSGGGGAEAARLGDVCAHVQRGMADVSPRSGRGALAAAVAVRWRHGKGHNTVICCRTLDRD